MPTLRKVETLGHFLGHFVTGLDGIGWNDSEGVSVGDGIHRYDSVPYLNSL